MENLIPKKIVEELDKFIIGQNKAKKSVAIALRNRYRREKLPDYIKDEVVPKNILMIGPTGVGKTEIARRLAKLTDAPFIKVEATKYTEVGYVGRDVESMVRELTEASVRMVEKARHQEVEEKSKQLALDRLAKILKSGNASGSKQPSSSPIAMLLGGMGLSTPPVQSEPQTPKEENEETAHEDVSIRQKLETDELDSKTIEIETEETSPSMVEIFSGAGLDEMGFNFQDMLGGIMPKKKKKRRVTVGEAKKILAYEEANKLIDMEEVKKDAIKKAEQHGIIFLDELDKIAGKESGSGPDVSRGGVQRDILPIIEGSTVNTKYGPVKTDHVLFIAAGAFHVSKPSDLIPELQGRFPIRVELENLGRDEFIKILTEPKNALIKQYKELLNTEGVEIEFTPEGIQEIAQISEDVNTQNENIGARRLHTVMEKVLENLSFNASEHSGEKIVIDENYVKKEIADIAEDKDLSRYIL